MCQLPWGLAFGMTGKEGEAFGMTAERKGVGFGMTERITPTLTLPHQGGGNKRDDVPLSGKEKLRYSP